ncbi:hypothetical protein ACFY8C_15875 [Streptomyces flavochromogenes]|uniref:Uncharacterized protein n=1 Tax=Streptomyces flavochromogenes TaxID=68199 RepID=A0ABW6XQM5_9ACTN
MGDEDRGDAEGELEAADLLPQAADGRPIEWTEDRCRAGSVTFNVSNSVGTAPLVRDPGSLLM